VPSRIPDLIDRTRRGQRLSRPDLETLVLGFTRGEVPDYQIAAWLMAVCCRGMEAAEVADLTEVMVDSGRRLDLSPIGPMVADKHSTGGVGDKTSLVVAPLVAACGLPVAKMSGRGLGFTGGTLDKLESIPGLSVELGADRFVAQVREIGLAIVGQSPELAPADGKLYALRDVTATVESIPLVASSVMSKKLAAGAPVIVLDVKTGSGAFMSTVSAATELAELMVEIGRAAGRKVAAFVTDMSQPLGHAVGNALEVAEAVETLRGGGPADLRHLAVVLASEILWLAGRAPNRREAQPLVERTLSAGTALQMLARMVRAQGGDDRYIYEPGLLPRAPLERVYSAPEAGLICSLDARCVADAALALGAGRERKGDTIDSAVGLVLAAKVGERVERGQPLATLHANDDRAALSAESHLQRAFKIAETPVPLRPLVHWRSGQPAE
jgi:pyrimidine-nucleoside phosphorylase